MARPVSSTRLKVHECTVLPMTIVKGLPPTSSPINRAELDLGETGGVLPVRLKVQLVRGSRGWRFVCPLCGRSAFKLYFPPESTEPACRTCLGLVYYSQYDYWSPAARMIRDVWD